MSREKQQERYSKSRARADQIYGDLFPGGSAKNGPDPGLFKSPYENDENDFKHSEAPEYYGEELPPTLVDGDCLGRLASSSAEERGHLMKKCPLLNGPKETGMGDLEEDIASPPFEAYRLIEGDDWRFDRCAWYRPIHFFGGNFGIFIKQNCIERIARRIAQIVDPQKLTVSIEEAAGHCRLAAYTGLLLHEFYHHKAESFSIRLAVGKSHFDMSDPKRSIPYLVYSKKVYRFLMDPNNSSLTDRYLVEEALANAYAYRQISQVPYKAILPLEVHKATRQNLKASFRFQPPGYRMAVNHLGTSSFSEGEKRLQQQILEGDYNTSSFGEKWWSAPGMLRSIFLVKEVPTHVVKG